MPALGHPLSLEAVAGPQQVHATGNGSCCERHTCQGPALTCVACGLSGPSMGRVSTEVQTTQASGHTALGSYLGAAIDLGTGFCALGIDFFM